MAITPTGKGTQEVNYPTNKVAGYVLVGALALGAIKLLTHLVQQNRTNSPLLNDQNISFEDNLIREGRVPKAGFKIR